MFNHLFNYKVVAVLNQRFHHCLSQCKQLNGQSLASQLGDSNAAQLTADKLLYNHAIDLVSLLSNDFHLTNGFNYNSVVTL